MIEAAQALDLYLSKFTEDIQSNPDSVKNFIHLLNNLEVVAKWFTEKSGNNLVNVFESKGDPSGNGIEINPITGHYYENLKTKPPLEYSEHGVELYEDNVKQYIVALEKSFKSMRALENVILTFSKIHNTNKSLISPGLIFKAFMKYAVASSLGFGILNTTVADFINTTGGGEYHPSLSDMSIHLSSKSGNDIQLRLFLRPVSELTKLDASGMWIIDPLDVGDSHFNEVSNSATPDTYYKNIDNKYLQTEEIYTMSIKSLVSKVFVVIGAYSLFNKPAKSIDNNNALSLRPLRQIMGGSVNAEIIPDATELYIRLLLLAEWYRELFKFDNSSYSYASHKGSSDKIISMIPAFDGIWSGFIKAVFLDGRFINDGNYTENNSNDIISSINNIYKHYRAEYGVNCCIKILESFVAEVNLRYGLVKRSEIDKYFNDRYKGLTNKDEYSDDENESLSILENSSSGLFNAPSKKFQNVNSMNIRRTRLLNKRFIQDMKEFRKRVEDNLRLNAIDSSVTDPRQGGPIIPNKMNNSNDLYNGSFSKLGVEYSGLDEIIRNVKKQLNKSDKKEHFKIIHSTIMGVEKFSDIDVDVMLMFHETVVNPLTILYSIYKIVNDWNGFISVLNCGENCTINDTNNHSNIIHFIDECGKNYHKEKLVNTYHNKKHLYFTHYLLKYKTNNSTASKIINDIMTKLKYMTCDKNKLFEVRFSGTGNENRYPILTYTELEKHVNILVKCVERSLNKFKRILPHNIISKYEKNKSIFTIEHDPTDSFNENVCSLYYIKEHLCDRLISNKYGLGLSSSNTALKNAWVWLTNKGELIQPSPTSK
jgi:hypothetical protein